MYREGGHEPLIPNGGRFKPHFAKRDEKHTMFDLHRSTEITVLKTFWRDITGFKTSLSRLLGE
jgi:hypothetical protein